MKAGQHHRLHRNRAGGAVGLGSSGSGIAVQRCVAQRRCCGVVRSGSRLLHHCLHGLAAGRPALQELQMV